MKERDFQKTVVEIAHRFNWKVAHFPTANPEGRFRTVISADAAGWPDLSLVRERLLFIECKAAKGALSPSQALWLDSLLKAGCEAYIVRPDDLEAIQDVLRHPGSRVGLSPAGWTWTYFLQEKTKEEIAKVLAKQAA